MSSTSYCDCGVCGVTVRDTTTTWLLPAWLEAKSIVPLYIPAVIPATFAMTTAEEGVVPMRGIT